MPDGGQRWHDGTDWTEHIVFSDMERADRLGEAVAGYVAAGWQVETQTRFNAVLSGGGHRSNHVVHALLTIFTCGFWLIIWMFAAAGEHPAQRITLRVDAQGNVIAG
jgi:hypothetical protein